MNGNKHFVNIIKNEADSDAFISKFSVEDFNKGSTLIVEPGEQAIFLNQGNVAQVFDSGSYKLDTQNYPFITALRSVISGGVSSFHCEVYFVRTATGREIKWGTQTPIKAYDKAYIDEITGLGIETEIRARGSYRVKVQDAALMLTQLVGNNYDFDAQENLQQFFREQFLGHILSSLTKELNAFERPLIEAPANALLYAEGIQEQIRPLLEEYGFQLLNFSISGLDIVDNEFRAQQMELVSANRERILGRKAEGEGEAAFAQGQQKAYEVYGTNYQQAQMLEAMKDAAGNSGGAGGQLMGAGIGLSMGAGLGNMIPEVMGDAMKQASPKQPEQTGPAARLQALKELKEQGLISEEEFNAKRAEIIGSI